MSGSSFKLEMSRMTRTDKEAFFSGLEQLECLSDGDGAEDDFGCLIAQSKPKNEGISSRPGCCQSQVSSLIPRPSDIVQLSSGDVSTRKVSPPVSVTVAPLTETRDVALDPQSSMAGSSKRPGSGTSKRKRGSTEKAIPEQNQIFKGLVFFFFPNNERCRLRCFRIQKAQDYGAIWAKDWGDDVTHVIVDQGIQFHEILKELKLEAIPPGVAVVDQYYTAECLSFRSMLNVAQVRFRVKGAPSSEPQELLKSSVEESAVATAGSLPLKPEGKQQPQTQISSQPSDGGDIHPLDHAPPVEGLEGDTEEIVRDSFSERERDALDDVIDEAKAIEHLPLDPLDALEGEGHAEPSGDETSDESQPLPAKGKKRKWLRNDNGSSLPWQQKFACMKKHDSSSNSGGPNARTIEVLQQMLDYYTRTADQWRTLAYRKAISALRNQPKKIVSRSEAIEISGIGSRLADKIEEIVVTNRLRRLDNTNNDAEDRLLQTFLGVYGAGLFVASKWIAQGYRSLEDLRTKASLTQAQRVGLDHYYDFSQRIPRNEVQAHGDFVRNVVQKESQNMQVIVGGSYRRGATSSGDIDLLITRPDATIEEIRTLMLDNVVPKLFQLGYLQVGLATTSRGDGSKWHGASKLPDGKLWRRIDLLFVPGAELGAALIYFTGNDIFNRSIRLLASRKGMRLNQRGLYADVMRGPQRAKINTGRLLESRDEQRIFELLGVPWRLPEHRIC